MLPISEIIGKIEGKEGNFQGEYYLALVINEKTIQSGVWGITSGQGKLFSCGSLEGWSGESFEELIVAADASIATAISKMPEISGKQPTKVLLGLPDQWIKDDNLKQDKMKILSRACKKLLLSPLGFVITPEAISHLLKEEEGSLPDLILVSLGETEIAVSLIIQGKFLGSKTVGRSDNLALDLEESLLRFNYQENFPSRILLLGSRNLEEARQTLIAYPWISPGSEKKISFLQLPRVDLAKENLEISALVYGGSKELLVEKGIPSTPEKEKEKIETVIEEGLPGQTTKEAKEIKETEEVAFKADFGFLPDKDIAESGELDLRRPADEKQEEQKGLEKVKTSFEEENRNPVTVPRKEKKKIFTILGSLFKRKPPASLPERRFEPENIEQSFPRRKQLRNFNRALKLVFNKITLFIFLLLVIFGGGFVFLFYKVVKAEVKVLTKPLEIEKQFDFSVSPKITAVDLEKMIIPAQEVTIEVSGESQAGVKGKKMVGEKASGEVIVFNRTSEVEKLSKGQVILGPANLKFLLKEDVNIASKTADIEKGVDKWGEVKTKVEAEDIGTQYNIEANSNLVIESYPTSSLLVKNTAAFSGGTSREIQAVSKEDKDNLHKKLLEELTNKAKDDIKTKIGPEDRYLGDSFQVKSITSHFDHEINDEASTLSLQEEVVFSGLIFKKEDINKLIDKNLSGSVPDNYQKKPYKEENSFNLKDKNEKVYLAEVKQQYFPIIASEEIVRNLEKKTFSQAGEYLRKVESTEGYEISIVPFIFSKFKLLPFNQGNIKITVESIGQ